MNLREHLLMKFKKTAACLAGLAFATGVVAKENNVGIFGTSGKTMGDHTYIAQKLTIFVTY
jgi:hypothetical protein